MKGLWNKYKKQGIQVILICGLVYTLGWNLGKTQEIIQMKAYLINQTENWGLGFGEDGSAPTGTMTEIELKEYDAYYKGNDGEKVIYLTFDCGFENGNTDNILKALKKHNVSATFFIVGNYLETSAELVKKMVDDGHVVGNHTYYHPDMTAKSQSQFEEEMLKMSDYYEEVIGKKMSSFYRPPQGKFSLENLQYAKDMGYHTIFWSLAYVDWYQDDQPTKEEAFDKILSRIHPGAVVLLHNTSKTNGDILDELLTKWEEMGYSFGSLEDLVVNG